MTQQEPSTTPTMIITVELQQNEDGSASEAVSITFPDKSTPGGDRMVAMLLCQRAISAAIDEMIERVGMTREQFEQSDFYKGVMEAGDVTTRLVARDTDTTGGDD